MKKKEKRVNRQNGTGRIEQKKERETKGDE